MSLPTNYSQSKRSYQAWDQDSKNYMIENIIDLDPFINTTLFNILIPSSTNPVGNKLIRQVNGFFTLYYSVSNVNPVTDAFSLLIDLEDVISDLLFETQIFSVLVISSDPVFAMVPAALFNGDDLYLTDKKISFESATNGPTAIPPLSTFLGRVDWLAKKSQSKLEY